MRIKKFVANSMPEAMKLIKAELGNDAIILNSKEIKPKGLFSFFQQKKIEVTAMLDSDVSEKKALTAKPIQRNSKMMAPEANFNEQKILEELKHLHSILATKSFNSENQFPPLMESIYQYLLSQEVKREHAKHIVTTMMKEPEDSADDKEPIEQRLRKHLERQFLKNSYGGIDHQTKIVQFVGPTGVGKTTTIAKVAARSMLEEKKSVAFITADTYRIAAIEQLKTYAKILDVPLEVVYSHDDYKAALNKFAHFNRIFVDTAGRNFREDHYLNELEQLINTPTYKTETYLVLSLTSKSTDVLEIFNRFKQIGIDQVIFTKLDETESYGSLLNLTMEEAINVAYITNGQNVPDDLIDPSASFMTDLMLRRYKHV